MAITATQSKAPASVTNIAMGSYIDTGTVSATAARLYTGFKPRYVKVFNETSGDQIEWFEGMTAAYGLKKVAAGTNSEITSLGITVYNDGFLIGLDTDIRVTSEQLRWLAIG